MLHICAVTFRESTTRNMHRTAAAASACRSRGAILFDGNSILHGAYHGTPHLTNRRGEPVHAVFTTLRSVISWLRTGGKVSHANNDRDSCTLNYHPWSSFQLAAVCWDRAEPTFRSKIFSDYKANRDASPDDLVPQFKATQDAIHSLGVCQFDAVGYEADDIIATLTSRLSSQGTPVTIVSADKDLLQLVREPERQGDSHVSVRLAHPFKRNIRSVSYVDQTYGVVPDRLPELFALVGDAADNVKGVKGIGVKIGGHLLSEYDNLASIEHAALELGDISKIGKKEKQRYDAKVMRGLKLVQKYILSSSEGVDTTQRPPLEALESIHRMIKDVPLHICDVSGSEFQRDDAEINVSENMTSSSKESLEAALSVPESPPAEFANMLQHHGFSSIFKFFPNEVLPLPGSKSGEIETSAALEGTDRTSAWETGTFPIAEKKEEGDEEEVWMR